MKTPVDIQDFGIDHWSTFAYLETRVVDHRGIPENKHMRSDPDRHPGHGHLVSILGYRKYPTRLRIGELKDHDDWDCVDDMEVAALIKISGTGLFPKWKLTDLGRTIASQLRAHLAQKRKYATFEPIIKEA